jgi:hypothetical protein
MELKYFFVLFMVDMISLDTQIWLDPLLLVLLVDLVSHHLVILLFE